MSTDIKYIESDNEIKVDRRKILRAEWRTTILEDGSKKYNKKPLDPLYFSKYYDKIRKEKEGAVVCCDRCNRTTTLGHMIRHQKSQYCVKRYNENIIKLIE